MPGAAAVFVTNFDPNDLRADFRDGDFWSRETPRFLSYARALILRHRWRGAYGDIPPGGEEPQDYVMRAAALILEGQRRCPAEVGSVAFVMGVIRSLVAHDSEKPENRQMHASVSDGDSGEDRQIADRNAAEFDELLTAGDLARDFVKALPEEYRPYVELLISGDCTGAAECAERLGVTVADIRSMDKAIRRRRRLWKGVPSP